MCDYRLVFKNTNVFFKVKILDIQQIFMLRIYSDQTQGTKDTITGISPVQGRHKGLLGHRTDDRRGGGGVRCGAQQINTGARAPVKRV